MSNINGQETTTLSLAAYLITAGHDCVGVKNNPGTHQIIFIFDLSKKEFEKLSGLFWSKKTTVDPLKYFENLKVLKSRIYQHQQNNV